MTCLNICGKKKNAETHSEAEELLSIPHQLRDYVEGDSEDASVTSLLESETAPEMQHSMSFALPREHWVDDVLRNTPRSPKSLSPKSNDSSASDPAEDREADNFFWRSVARNLMTFELGVHLEKPELSVGDVDDNNCDLTIERDDPQRAFDHIVADLKGWVQKRKNYMLRDEYGARVGESIYKSKSTGRRASLSGLAKIDPDNEMPRRNSPKMFIDDPSAEDELRTFVGLSANGVPIMRLNVMRCCENALHTDSMSVCGLIVISVDFAKQIEILAAPYSAWLVEYIVDAHCEDFDFIRLSSKFRENNAPVVDRLLLAKRVNCVNNRVMCYAKERPFSFSVSRRASAFAQ